MITMEEKKFKKKLTISTSGPIKKRTDKFEYAKGQNRSSVIVVKKNIRSGFKKSGQQTQRHKTKTFIKSGKIFDKNPNLFGRDLKRESRQNKKPLKEPKDKLRKKEI